MWIIFFHFSDAIQPSIIGVFKERMEAEKYLFSIVSHEWIDDSTNLKLKEIPSVDYPVIFFNDFEHCEYTSLENLAEKLSHLKKMDDEDHQYGIYYIFYEDYRGILPGEEYLKFIDHHHVDHNKIKSLIKRGLKIDTFRERDVGIYRCDYCGKKTHANLTINGYLPPAGWQIYLLHDSEEGEEKYECVCSAECWKLFEQEDL